METDLTRNTRSSENVYDLLAILHNNKNLYSYEIILLYASSIAVFVTISYNGYIWTRTACLKWLDFDNLFETKKKVSKTFHIIFTIIAIIKYLNLIVYSRSYICKKKLIPSRIPRNYKRVRIANGELLISFIFLRKRPCIKTHRISCFKLNTRLCYMSGGQPDAR